MRLTKAIKEEILEKLLQPTYEKNQARRKLLFGREQAVADAIYDTLYTTSEREAMEAMGERFFQKTDRIAFSFLQDGSYVVLLLSEKRYFAQADTSRAVLVGNEEKVAQLRKEYMEILKERGDLSNEAKNLRRDTWAVLQPITTVKKLYDRWPGIADIISEVVADNAPNSAMLPSVVPVELSKRLGL